VLIVSAFARTASALSSPSPCSHVREGFRPPPAPAWQPGLLGLLLCLINQAPAALELSPALQPFCRGSPALMARGVVLVALLWTRANPKSTARCP